MVINRLYSKEKGRAWPLFFWIWSFAHSGPLRYVLWCCGSICLKSFTFIQIGPGHTVSTELKKGSHWNHPFCLFYWSIVLSLSQIPFNRLKKSEIVRLWPSITVWVHRNENFVDIIPVFSTFSQIFNNNFFFHKSHFM